MRLKSLEMQGFKSFPDRTKLEFKKGFTAVVGPNGCGKSNISDAIRWVLGEQSTKALRGSKMEDVIFLGTKERPQQGFAQVELTFDNIDYSKSSKNETVISRKYYRDGESEYLLNGRNVQLKDISAILMDTGLSKEGYSIIGQGRIEEIVSAKSVDRRQIFDECAGITKYRYRKKEAQKKLLLAEENLLRLTDILNELKDRIEPLKVQSLKAKEFISLEAQKRQFEISIWANEIKSVRCRIKEKQDKLYIANSDYKNEEEKLNSISENLKGSYDKIQSLNLQIEQSREEMAHLTEQASSIKTKTALLEGEISYIKNDIERITKEILSFNLSIDKLKSEISQKEKELKNYEQENDYFNCKKVEVEEKLKNFHIKAGKVNQKSDMLTEIINKNTLEKSRLNINIAGYNNRIIELTEEKGNLKNLLKNYQDEMESLIKDQDQVNSLLSDIGERNISLNNSKSGYHLKLKSLEVKLNTINYDIDKDCVKLTEQSQKLKMLIQLESNLDGFAHSVKNILQVAKQGRLNGVRGTISQLLTTDKRFALAIETALGSTIQNIVVDDERTAKDGIEWLKINKAGRATFLPLTTIKPHKLIKVPTECVGFIGIGSELISNDPIYNNIFSSLLSKTVVVEDIVCGSDMAKKYGYSFKIVTIDGQIINPGGSYTGGYRSKGTGILSRQSEIDDLKKNIEKIKAIIETNNKNKIELKAKITDICNHISSIDAEILICKEDKIKFIGELKRITELIDKTKSTQKAYNDKSNDIEKKEKEIKDNINSANKNIKKAQAAIISSNDELKSIVDEKETIKQEHMELEDEIYSYDIKIVKIKESITNLKSLITNLTERTGGDKSKQYELDIALKKNENIISEKHKEIDKLLNQAKDDKQITNELEQKIVTLTMEKNNNEKNRETLIKEEKLILEAKEKFGREISKLEEQKETVLKLKDNIASMLWEGYELAISEAEKEAVEIADVDLAKRQLTSIKNKIKNLGNVNLGALEEFKEVSTRYDFLNNQLMDAKSAKDDLTKLISDLTSSMKKMFINTFNKVNSNFANVFKELFEGGEAKLYLDDPDNVLECGINIEVEPPGKIIKNLSSLSGGEKAFVAIAIYFAILKVRPAPFCVLDEIEAALDDVNVKKFSSYLKRIDKNTQFIVITHRRGTMETADTLYGVTMQEEGVSKLLKLPSKQTILTTN